MTTEETASGTMLQPAQEKEPVQELAPANVIGVNAMGMVDSDPETLAALKNLEERRRRARRKRVITIVIVCCVVAALILVPFVMNLLKGKSATSGEAELQTAVATRGDLTSSVQATGSLKPGSYVAVTPEVSGVIEQVAVVEGQQVQAGDVLLTLRNADLEKAVADAASSLEKARNAVGTAQNEVSAAYDSYNEAIDAYNAAVDRYNSDNLAGDPGTFDHSGYLSAIRAAESSVTSAQESQQDAQRAYDYAVEQADKRTVRASVAGSVLDLKAVAGASVGGATGGTSTATGALMQIADLSTLNVDVEVNEIDIDSVQPGQRAKITFTAVPGLEVEGQVTSVASVSSSSSTEGATGSSGGVVTFKVTTVISSPDKRLKPGMSANVSILTKDVPNVVIVPSSALIEDKKSTYVLVAKDETGKNTEMREVTVGERAGSQVSVESGLEEGEIVVLSTTTDAAGSSQASSAASAG